jgi:hypothetical protein
MRNSSNPNIGESKMNTQNIVTWNTGRMYSDKGQRIAATVLEDGRVMFADVDRMIDGITNADYPYGIGLANSVIQRFVMDEYDYGRISYGYYGFGDYEKGSELMQALKDAANATK